MFDLIKKYRLLLSILVTLGCLLILLVRVGKSSPTPAINTVAYSIVYPLQVTIHKVTTFVNDITKSYIDLVDLAEENRTLKEEISVLKEELNNYIEDSIQYHRLKVQLEFAETNPNKTVFAEVIGESIDNFHQTLMINRGSNHGIQKNFAVILQEGVIGRIQSVTLFQSSVQLIIDQRSRFPAIIQKTRAKGILYGTGSGLKLGGIQLRSEIDIGDRVITSGLSQLFPKGLLIGIVNKVIHEEHELFKTAILTPIVDFKKIENVFVVLKSNTNLQIKRNH